jgi:hypothetical protein
VLTHYKVEAQKGIMLCLEGQVVQSVEKRQKEESWATINIELILVI